MWLGRDVLFLIAKMNQDPVDDVLILNAGDGFDGSTAAAANLDINVECPLQTLRPGHRRVTLNG